MGRIVCFTLGVALLVPVASLAAPPPPPPPRPPPADLPPPPPPPPPAAAIECFPACRTGFFCYQGQCRSACNPPCLAGEQCLDNGQCVLAGSVPPPVPPPIDAPLAPPVDTRPQGPVVNAEGEQAPPGFHFETQRRKALLVTGPVLFGVGYILSVFYGVLGYSFAGLGTSSTTSFVVRNRGTYLVYAVPLVGPALSQFLFATSYGYSNVSSRQLEFLFAGVVTVLQVTGLTLAILGIPSRQVLVEDRRAEALGFSPLRLSLAPGSPSSPLGLTLLLEN